MLHGRVWNVIQLFKCILSISAIAMSLFCDKQVVLWFITLGSPHPEPWAKEERSDLAKGSKRAALGHFVVGRLVTYQRKKAEG